MKPPNLMPRQRAFRLIFCFWSVVFLQYIVIGLLSGRPLANYTSRMVVIVGFALLLSVTGVVIVLRFRKKGLALNIISVIAVAAIIAVTHVTALNAGIGTVDALFHVTPPSEYGRSIALYSEALGGAFFINGSLFLLVLWQCSNVEAFEAERREAAARDAAREAQLLALRYQVDPHFLFNCLNSLATLVNRGDRDAAGSMIREMSDFLRYGLASDPISDVELEDEVDMQRRYLEIERCRFSHRLTLEVDVADDVRQARVPSLILQPLVENAIKHGVASTSAPVTVLIRAARNAAGQLAIEVEDDAPSSGAPIRSFGIGLRNVAERLATRFDGAATLDAHRLPRGGFRATLTLPLVRA